MIRRGYERHGRRELRRLTEREREIRAAAKRRTPQGWTIVERIPRYEAVGVALEPVRRIYIPPLIDENALYVFLHEVGHIQCRHFAQRCSGDCMPPWQLEYEAECWAIAMMRKEGFAVSRRLMSEARANVQHRIEEAVWSGKLDEQIEQWGLEAVKFAFPNDWRTWAL